uniref:Uncharacterized protein n=1 Tax=Arundo donax TaxID=35708 RepID=A0A0A9F2G7_ARUDO
MLFGIYTSPQCVLCVNPAKHRGLSGGLLLMFISRPISKGGRIYVCQFVSSTCFFI